MSTVFAWGVDRSETGFDGGDHKVIDLKAMAAEFIVMTLFVIIGCGTACKIAELPLLPLLHAASMRTAQHGLEFVLIPLLEH